jgi:hypothetical protein
MPKVRRTQHFTIGSNATIPATRLLAQLGSSCGLVRDKTICCSLNSGAPEAEAALALLRLAESGEIAEQIAKILS